MNLSVRSAFGKSRTATSSSSSFSSWDRRQAFTLIEVMMAMLLFFLAVFSILELVSVCLRNARLLQRPTVNTTSVASWYSVTNRIMEVTYSGDFKDLLGDEYKNFEWQLEPTEITNGLFIVPVGTIERTSQGRGAVSTMTILLYQPNSAGRGGPPRR